ncbi:MAG: hypothetical protein RSG59_01795 [Ruthenibacterium sp.]
MGAYLLTVYHRTAQAVPTWRAFALAGLSQHPFAGAVTGMIVMGAGLAAAVSAVTVVLVVPLSFLLGW